MKFMKIYIVTYKRNDVLNALLKNLYKTDFSLYENTEVTIINNHTDFYINEKLYPNVKVMHNMTRPDWSPGNLSENYNQAFLDGFRSLKKPDCKYLVTLQNDALLNNNWVSNLIEMHKKYSFVFGEYGDNFASYMPEAVRKIGMWDENFCGGQYKEADYCIRALIHNKDKSIINDRLANLYHNEKDWLPTVITEERNYQDVKGQLKRLADDKEHKKIKIHQTAHRDVLMKYMQYKWNNTWKKPVQRKGWITDWSKDFVANPPKFPKHKQFFRYYYFEKDIEDLKGKGYLLP